MSLLIARDLSLSYGRKVLLDEDSVTFAAADRVALVGPNGAGKSSLMKILAGTAQPDSGEVQLVRGARLGYLPQELQGLPEGPLVEAVLSQVPGRTRLEDEVAQVEQALAEETEEESQLELAQRLADLRETLTAFDERFGRHRAEEILLGLGFRPNELLKRTQELSGGWRMRAALAGLLLTDPDVLLLDEPTNHLDVPTLAWFDSFLQRSRHALILISHDRDFLNRQVRRIVSFEPEGLRSYAGNYDDYKRLRAAEAEQLASAAAKQEARRVQLEAFIERFRAKASKAKQVKSREKMLAREETIRQLEERRVVSFRFPEVERSGRDLLAIRGIRKAFADKKIYDGIDLQVLRGERIAIVGPNGAGKTTLLKIIAGELKPDAGEIALGHNVTPGYYAQHHTERLNPKGTVLGEVTHLVPDKPQSYVRGVLGAFLFSGDDVEKPISALSGGERARVALAKLLVSPTNLLLMDEPTNHLDLDSSEALIDALSEYSGTLVFVSHNRSFVNRLATHVWEVDGGGVAVHPGNLDDYLYHKDQLAKAALGAAGSAGKGAAESAKGPVNEKERKRLEAEARQAKSVREKPIRQEIARLEKRIAELEEQAKVAESALADPQLYADFDRAKPHMDAFRTAKDELEALYEKWAEQQALLEA